MIVFYREADDKFGIYYKKRGRFCQWYIDDFGEEEFFSAYYTWDSIRRFLKDYNYTIIHDDGEE